MQIPVRIYLWQLVKKDVFAEKLLLLKRGLVSDCPVKSLNVEALWAAPFVIRQKLIVIVAEITQSELAALEPFPFHLLAFPVLDPGQVPAFVLEFDALGLGQLELLVDLLDLALEGVLPFGDIYEDVRLFALGVGPSDENWVRFPLLLLRMKRLLRLLKLLKSLLIPLLKRKIPGREL